MNTVTLREIAEEIGCEVEQIDSLTKGIEFPCSFEEAESIVESYEKGMHYIVTDTSVTVVYQDDRDNITIPRLDGSNQISVVWELLNKIGEVDIRWADIKLDAFNCTTNLTVSGEAQVTTVEELIDHCQYWYYDNGFGSQELFGTVMLANNSWLTRSEYDGSESWELNRRPKTPSWVTDN